MANKEAKTLEVTKTPEIYKHSKNSQTVKVRDEDFVLVDNTTKHVDTNFHSQGFWKGFITRFFSKKKAIIGLVIIGIIVLFAIFGPIISKYTYFTTNTLETNLAPRMGLFEWMGILDGSEVLKTTTGTKMVNYYESRNLLDVYHWFGTDSLGRDIWTRTWHGARVSLLIAIIAAAIDVVIGMSYGLVSGYFGGIVDSAMQRFVEIIQSIPRLVVVILLSLVLQRGIVAIIVALFITEWIGMARISRAEMLRLKDREYILASKTLGANNISIIFKDVLPNTIGPIITQVMFSIPTAIFTEAFLSFAGLGIPIPECSLGSLISDGFNVFNIHAYQILPPIIVLALLMLSFSLVGDSLREALAPKKKDM